MQIPNAKKEILPNGITLLTEEIPSLRSVSLGLMVGAGSSVEKKEEMGISHFIEHTVFKGTSHRNALQIAQTLDNVGGKLNAFTSKEFTMYYAIVQDKHIDVALDLLSDIYLNPLFKEDDINLEKNVVLEEIRMYEDTPDEQIHDLFISTILHNHSFGNITLGEEKTVKSFNQENINTYRKKHYSADNLIISAAGNINQKEVKSEIYRIFSNISDKKENGLMPIPKITPNLALKKKETEQVHLLLGSKGVSQTDDDRYAFAVLDGSLGGSMSSRLFQEIREKRALAYSIYSFNQGFKEIGLFGIYAGIQKENFEKVINLILEQLKNIKKEGISKEELERSKENIKGSMVLALESSNSRMNYIAKSQFYYDKIITIDDIIKKIDKVTLDYIINLANKYFLDEYLNLAVIGDLEKLPFEKLSL